MTFNGFQIKRACHDININKAISVIEDNSKEENTVVEVIQRGFTIQERILRPSGVIVSKKSKKNK